MKESGSAWTSSTTVGAYDSTITVLSGVGGGSTAPIYSTPPTISFPPTTSPLRIPTTKPARPVLGDLMMDPETGSVYVYTPDEWKKFDTYTTGDGLDPNRPRDVELD